jgi:sugar-specific transcriptional regulator TrmB
MAKINVSALSSEELADLQKALQERQSVLTKVNETKTAVEKVITKAGYSDVKSFLVDAGWVSSSKASATRKGRARLTDDDKAAIVADLKKGEMTGSEIAEKHGVSQPTVNGLKKAAGLTKPKGKK